MGVGGSAHVFLSIGGDTKVTEGDLRTYKVIEAQNYK